MSSDVHATAGGGHETRDVRIKPIIVAFVGLALVALLVHVLMYLVLAGFTARDLEEGEAASPLAAAVGRKAPPEPRLQIAPRDDLRRLHAREDALLHGYGWVDRDAGVARIPIERAMALLAERGLPETAVPAADAAGAPAAKAPTAAAPAPSGGPR